MVWNSLISFFSTISFTRSFFQKFDFQDAKSENNDAVSMVSDDLELSDDDEDSNDSIATNRKKAEILDKVPETSEIEVTAGSKVDTTEDETKDSKEPESSKNSSNQGNLLRSIVN